MNFRVVTAQVPLSAQDSILPFLPEVMEQFPNVRDIAISSDGGILLFTVESLKKEFSAILIAHNSSDGWSDPEVAPFSGRWKDLEPAFSPDGKRLYFVSNRPVDDEGDIGDFDIWYVEMRDDGQWSEPVNPGPPLNSDADEYYPSITSNGDIFFTSERENSHGKEDIYVARIAGSGYAVPQPLDTMINSNGYEFNAFVAPDESYIIYTGYGREDGLGGGDLYISLKDGRGNWQKSVPLRSPVNSPFIDYCPFVDTAGKVFYFTSQRSKMNDHFTERMSLPALIQEIRQFQNGSGRIYAVSFDTIESLIDR